MALKYSLTENQLTPRPDDFMAQTVQVRYYTIEEIADLMLNRGTLLTKADILAVLEVYHTELADIVAKGDGANTPIVHIAPAIGGVFESINDGFDSLRHKIRLNINAGVLLREAQKKIRVEKVAATEHTPVITQVLDVKSGTINDLLTPGRNLKISGNKVKIAGDSARNGIFFVDVNTGTRVKVDESDIVTNNPSELIVIVPELAAGNYKVEVTTQYSGSSTLKEPRTYIFNKILIVG